MTNQTSQQLALNLKVWRGDGETSHVQCETPGCTWRAAGDRDGLAGIRPEVIKAHLLQHPDHAIHARYVGHEVFRVDNDPYRRPSVTSRVKG